MELRHLRYFIAVAEERHFGRAAERLFLSQPPLSLQIRQLEEELGVTLFARTSRHVALTEAGRSFLKDAREILYKVDHATERARRAARGESGWIGIGFVGSATYDVLPRILRTFREQYPDITMELHELLTEEQGAALQEGKIHIGFSRFPPVEEGLIHETAAREPLMAALPESHPFADKPEVALRDLANDPFLLFPRRAESRYAEHLIQLCRAAGFEPNVIQETGEMQTAVSLVSAGIGISLVPGAVRHLRRMGVAYVPLAEPTPPIELTVSHRRGETSPVVPRFLEIVRTVTHDAAATGNEG